MEKKIAISKIVRILTMPPIMAAALSILLWIRKDIFGGICNYLTTLFFLTVLPLLAYPLQPALPHFKEKGRDGQRQLAIKVNLPCVDWPFYIALSKSVGEARKILW